MTTKVKQESFILGQGDTNLIPSSRRNDGTADRWSTIWEFKIPAGQLYIVGPDDTLSFYLEDDSPAEVGDFDCQIRLRMTDVAGSDEKLIMNAVPYVQVKEWQDRRKVAHIQANQSFRLQEEQSLLIEVKDNAAIDESDSAFNISMHRVYEGI